jgi:hypothetical protein
MTNDKGHTMHIRDRILEFTRVPASKLAPSPRNWRMHPAAQREALQGVLAEIGYASAIVARRRSDGQLEIIDGHLRAETTPDEVVPVLVLDVNEAEADKLLLTFDPLSAMAQRDDEKYTALAASVHPQHPAVRKMIDEMRGVADRESARSENLRENVELSERYAVLVDCDNETEQQAVYQRLVSDGLECRLMTL